MCVTYGPWITEKEREIALIPPDCAARRVDGTGKVYRGGGSGLDYFPSEHARPRAAPRRKGDRPWRVRLGADPFPPLCLFEKGKKSCRALPLNLDHSIRGCVIVRIRTLRPIRALKFNQPTVSVIDLSEVRRSYGRPPSPTLARTPISTFLFCPLRSRGGAGYPAERLEDRDSLVFETVPSAPSDSLPCHGRKSEAFRLVGRLRTVFDFGPWRGYGCHP